MDTGKGLIKSARSYYSILVRVRVTELVFSQIGFTTGVIVLGAERGL